MLGFVFAIIEVFVKDYRAVLDNGFFQGYNGTVWTVVSLQVSKLYKLMKPSLFLHKGKCSNLDYFLD